MNVYSRFYKTHECQQDYLSISISWMNFDWVQNVPKVSSWCCAKWWGLKLGEMPCRVPCLEQHQQIPWQLLRKHLGHCPPGKGLETLADGNFRWKKHVNRDFVQSSSFGIIGFLHDKNGGPLILIFKKKNISPFFVGNCHFNDSETKTSIKFGAPTLLVGLLFSLTGVKAGHLLAGSKN